MLKVNHTVKSVALKGFKGTQWLCTPRQCTQPLLRSLGTLQLTANHISRIFYFLHMCTMAVSPSIIFFFMYTVAEIPLILQSTKSFNTRFIIAIDFNFCGSVVNNRQLAFINVLTYGSYIDSCQLYNRPTKIKINSLNKPTKCHKTCKCPNKNKSL